jgi:hypothetical protein
MTVYKNICKECGKEFDSIGVKRVFCSSECRWKPHNHPNFNIENTIIVKCDYCGKELTRNICDIKNNKYHFCNRDCKSKHISTVLVGEKSANWRGGHVKKICIVCGKEFYVSPYKGHSDKHGKCCSNECRYKLKRITMTGKGNPMYEDGKSKFPYCEKFNAEFKRRVREFFGNKCLLCGKTEEENNTVMSIHHIHKNVNACCDNTEKRFAPLCRSCHATITNYERYDKDKMGEYIKTLNDIIDTQYNGKCYYEKGEVYKFLGE